MTFARNFGHYRHAERIDAVYDSIHVDLGKVPALADYPPDRAQSDDANMSTAAAS